MKPAEAIRKIHSEAIKNLSSLTPEDLWEAKYAAEDFANSMEVEYHESQR